MKNLRRQPLWNRLQYDTATGTMRGVFTLVMEAKFRMDLGLDLAMTRGQRRRLADGRLFCRFTVEDKDQRYLLEQFMERASLLVLPYERLN